MSLASKAPRVALIGRPNVGKSTLFNILTRTRKALVKDQPGVTRDVLVEPADWWGKNFDVVDTGGITEATDQFSQLIREQVLSIVSSFDALIVVMDGRVGLVPEDRDLVRIAKESGRPFIIAVNKIDQAHKKELMLSEFYEFGIDVIGCSFERREGVDEVVEWVISNVEEDGSTQREGIRLAIVGKPNVGKSSLCNFLLKQNRMLVSDIAGTTVDLVEEEFTFNDQPYILVDTAGMRKQAKRKEGVEEISAFFSKSAISKADVVLLMVDGLDGVTDQDSKVMQTIIESHKAVILVSNKLDTAVQEKEAFRSWFRNQIIQTFHYFSDVPVQFISAKTGAGIPQLFERIEELCGKLQTRIPTSKLNDFFYKAIRQAPAPVYGTQNVKFYYLTQTHQSPPSFIAFANYPTAVTPAYKRFLSKRIKEKFDLSGIPIRIFVMGSKS